MDFGRKIETGETDMKNQKIFIGIFLLLMMMSMALSIITFKDPIIVRKIDILSDSGQKIARYGKDVKNVHIEDFHITFDWQEKHYDYPFSSISMDLLRKTIKVTCEPIEKAQ